MLLEHCAFKYAPGANLLKILLQTQTIYALGAAAPAPGAAIPGAAAPGA